MLPDRESALRLSLVRRFEAAGFRAWPAGSVRYDGTWVLRLTAGHPAKRLNSVAILDPGDLCRIDERIEAAGRWFEAFGRPLTFRISPLAGTALSEHLDARGWTRFGEVLVMSLDLEKVDFTDVIDQIPMKDLNRFISAMMRVRDHSGLIRPGLSEVISSIRAEPGLFVHESGGVPVATTICVHDGELAGLFEVGTQATLRRRGFGRAIVLSAIKWARMRGARVAWLQVEAENEGALALYRQLGFEEVYRYHYRRPPGAAVWA